MPYNVSLSYLLRYGLTAFFFMAAGSQTVHMIYRPDLSIPDHPVAKGELHTKLFVNSSDEKPS